MKNILQLLIADLRGVARRKHFIEENEIDKNAKKRVSQAFKIIKEHSLILKYQDYNSKEKEVLINNFYEEIFLGLKNGNDISSIARKIGKDMKFVETKIKKMIDLIKRVYR